MISVLGAGSWGTALAVALARNQKEVLLWSKESKLLDDMLKTGCNNKYLPGIALPSDINYEKDLVQAISRATDILIAVPSHAFSSILLAIKPYLTAQRIVWATKGLEPGTGRFLHDVLKETLGPAQVCGVLSGPSFALEVAKGLPTAVVVACTCDQFAKALTGYFHGDTFRIYINQDMIGVQLGGVVKNIFALATGISDGLGFGANARAALITRGLAELMRLGRAMGAKEETLIGLAGCGDLILTCTDNQSRNRRFGLALAEGLDHEQAQTLVGQVVEARYNVEEIYKLGLKYQIELPITEQVLKILKKEVTPKDAVVNLISRTPTFEFE